MNPELLPEAALLISKDLGLVPISDEFAHEYDLIKQWLAENINDLLQNNPDYLRWVLYRLDIDQNKAMSAFEQSKRASTAFLLADLIIERECQKTKTRQWYKQKMNQNKEKNTSNDALNEEYADKW